MMKPQQDPVNTYPANIQRVIEAVLAPGGDSTPALRQRAMDYATVVSAGQTMTSPLPIAWQSYIDTVTKHAYRTTDSQVEQLKAAGHSEDAIFEMTIATALGAGLARLACGLTAIAEANGGTSCD